MVGTIFNIIDGSTYLWATIYFDYINKHYFWFCQLGFWINLLNVAGLLLFVPESPLWLLKSGKTERAKAILYRIKSMNGLADDADFAKETLEAEKINFSAELRDSKIEAAGAISNSTSRLSENAPEV